MSAYLAAEDKQLKALRQARGCSMPLCERAHDLGMVDDKRGADALTLQILAHQLVQQPRRGQRRVADHAVLVANLPQLLVGLFARQVVYKLGVQGLFQIGDHVQALERRRKVDLDGLSLWTCYARNDTDNNNDNGSARVGKRPCRSHRHTHRADAAAACTIP